MKSLLELKEEGNIYFRKGDYDKALSCYTQALKIGRNACEKDKDRGKKNEKAVILKNRAACYLKLVSNCEYSESNCFSDKWSSQVSNFIFCRLLPG